MTFRTFHFDSYEPAIRFHISKRLMAQGWHIVPTKALANFHDDHLTLDDKASQFLEQKHLLAKLSQRFFPTLMPETFYIDEKTAPRVLKRLSKHPLSAHPWILKPALLNNGDHIYVFSNVSDLKAYYAQPKRLGGPHVIQKYLEDPKLWSGYKYTFRMPVVITRCGGVFMHEQGYINISATAYEGAHHYQNRKQHLTNYILDGTLAGIEQRITDDDPDFSALRQQFKTIIQKVIQALWSVFPHYLCSKDEEAFEIFGFDFIVDKHNRAWLLEVNQGPDFPLTDHHPLYHTLWAPFWTSICEDFVGPVAAQEAIKPNPRQWNLVLNAKHRPSLWQKWLGRRLLNQCSPLIEAGR